MTNRTLAIRAFYAISIVTVLFATKRSHAEDAFILPTQGTAARAADADRLVQSLVARLATAGITARPTPRALVDRAEAAIGCDSPTCARAGLDALVTDFIVAPSFWQTATGDFEFSCSILGHSGEVVEITREIPRDALRSPDAMRPLEDELIGRLPELRRVPDEPAAHVDPNPLVRPAPVATELRRSNANFGLGLGLIAAAIVPTLVGTSALVRDGRCATSGDQGGCARRDDGAWESYHFGARSVAVLSTGAALAATGVVFLAVRPLRIRVMVDADTAGLEARGAF